MAASQQEPIDMSHELSAGPMHLEGLGLGLGMGMGMEDGNMYGMGENGEMSEGPDGMLDLHGHRHHHHQSQDSHHHGCNHHNEHRLQHHHQNQHPRMPTKLNKVSYPSESLLSNSPPQSTSTFIPTPLSLSLAAAGGSGSMPMSLPMHDIIPNGAAGMDVVHGGAQQPGNGTSGSMVLQGMHQPGMQHGVPQQQPGMQQEWSHGMLQGLQLESLQLGMPLGVSDRMQPPGMPASMPPGMIPVHSFSMSMPPPMQGMAHGMLPMCSESMPTMPLSLSHGSMSAPMQGMPLGMQHMAMQPHMQGMGQGMLPGMGPPGMGMAARPGVQGVPQMGMQAMQPPMSMQGMQGMPHPAMQGGMVSPALPSPSPSFPTPATPGSAGNGGNAGNSGHAHATGGGGGGSSSVVHSPSPAPQLPATTILQDYASGLLHALTFPSTLRRKRSAVPIR